MILSIGPSLGRILQLIPPNEMKALAQRLHLPTSQEPQLRAVYDALIDDQRLLKSLEHLSPSARAFTTDVILHGGSVTWEQATLDPQFEQIFQELIPTMILFSIEDRYASRSFVIPGEFDNLVWSKTVITTVDSSLAAEESTPRREHEASDWFPFLQEVYQVLSFGRVEPIQLTQQGYVYKRVEAKVLQKIWPKLEPDLGSAKLHQILTYALANHLMGYADEGRSLRVNENNCSQFFDLDVFQHFQSWFSYSYERATGTYFRQILVGMAAFLQPDQWLDMKQFMRWLTMHRVPEPTVSQLVQFHTSRLIATGIWEGTMERGRLTDPAYYAMIRQFGTIVPRQAVVEPTGEVLVAPEAPWAERWAWDQMTTLVRADRMSVYQIDSPGLERARDLNLDLDAAVAAMESMSKSSIPANVRANLDDWRRALTRHRVLQATVIHSVNPRDSQEVEHRLGNHVVLRLSDTDLVIRPAEVQHAIRLLNKAGIMVRARVEHPGAEEPGDESSLDPRLWSPYGTGTDAYADPFYTVSAHVPSANLKVPNFQKIHTDLETAIAQKATVQVTHIPPGQRQEVTQAILPVQLYNGWLQGTVVSSRQMANIQMKRIQDVVAEESS